MPSEVRFSMVLTEQRCPKKFLFQVCGSRLCRVEVSEGLRTEAARVGVQDGDLICCGAGMCGISTGLKLKPLLEVLK